MNARGDLIRSALPLYGLQGCEYTLLRTLGDAVARVETPDGPRSLRVNLPGPLERLHEICRFQALAHAAGLHVPLPLPDLSGQLVSPMPEGRTAVLAAWVEGQPAGRLMSPAFAAEVGRVTARLHALNFRPDHWHGPVHDADWLRGWWQEQAPLHLSAADLGRCLPAIEAAAMWLDDQRRSVQVVHADLHFGNLLALPGGEVGVLDFGDCALVHPAFDLAMTETEFLDFPDGPALVGAYRAAHSAEANQSYPLTARQHMAALTDTAFLAWVYGSANEQVREQKLRWIPRLLDRLADG